MSRVWCGARLALAVSEIGKNLATILHQRLQYSVEGMCIAQGYVKPGSVLVLTYSSGVASGATVTFDVSYQCLICRPVEGMLIRGCVVKTSLRQESGLSPKNIRVPW